MSETPDMPEHIAKDMLDDLTCDLRPVQPMRGWRLWGAAAVGLCLGVVWIMMTLNLRAEVVYLLHGIRLSNPMVLMKPLMFLITGLAAVWAVAGLSRPQGRLKLRYLLPVLGVLGLIIGNFVAELLHDTPAEMAEKLNGGAMTCFSTILTGGAIGLAALWGLWLRRTATSHPVLLGGMSGLACASLMASAYALHCNMDAPVYIFAVYGTAVTLFTGIAALLGARLLKW